MFFCVQSVHLVRFFFENLSFGGVLWVWGGYNLVMSHLVASKFPFPTRSFNVMDDASKISFLRWWDLHGEPDSVPKTAQMPDVSGSDAIDEVPVPDSPSIKVALKEIKNFNKPTRRTSVPKRADETVDIDASDGESDVPVKKVSKKVSDCGVTLQSASDRAVKRSKKSKAAKKEKKASPRPAPVVVSPALSGRRRFGFIVLNR